MRKIARAALKEDLGKGDLTTIFLIPEKERATAAIMAKEAGVLAGLPVAREVFLLLDPGLQIIEHRKEGEKVRKGETIAILKGLARAILSGERTALNFLCHLSGIATLTRRFVDAAGGRIVIRDTRKTTPGLRALEKYAVRAGGGENHRSGLDTGILIKDNHIVLAGSVGKAVTIVRRKLARRHGASRAKGMPVQAGVEAEVQSLSQALEAVEAGCRLLLLDNMGDEETRAVVRQVGRKADLEISGRVTLQNVERVARLGARYVAVGALTHSAPALDLSLEMIKSEPAPRARGYHRGGQPVT